MTNEEAIEALIEWRDYRGGAYTNDDEEKACGMAIAALREVEQSRAAVDHFKVFIGFAVSCQIRNTDDWMRMMVHRVNEACTAIGDKDKFKFDGFGLCHDYDTAAKPQGA